MNTTTAPSHDSQSGPAGSSTGGESQVKTLTRSRHDRMAAGVAAGNAGYLGIDALLVRIAFAVLTIVGGVGIPLYLACWLLIPDEGTNQSILAEFTGNAQAWRN